jgi:very-short-patch-repair endonuclease
MPRGWRKGEKNIAKRPEIREKLRLKKIGNSNGFKKGHKINSGRKNSLGYKYTDIQKQKMRKSHNYPNERKYNPNRKFKDTSIELKIETELQRRNINYQKQVPLCKIAIVDFYLPEYRIVIQCDGDYWHNLPGVKEKDERQDKVLIFNGFNIYRFWEHEINESVKKCIDIVLRKI